MWSCARNAPADYTVAEGRGCHSKATSELDPGLVYQDEKEVYGEVMKWQKPVKDGYEQIAAIFTETADNEKEHAKIWFKLLNDGIGSTEENLKNAAEGEHFEWAEMYADFAKTAEEEGFANIARLFSGVAAIEKSHEQRFLTLERSVREGGVFQSGEETTVWICRNCGHIAVGKTAPQVCPVCGHPQAYFQRRAENY